MGTCSMVVEEGSCKMLKFFISLACLGAATHGSMDAMRMIQRDMTQFNNDVTCWGLQNTIDFNMALYQATEQCMQYGNPLAGFTKPANPFAQLQQNFQTLPQNINRNALSKWNKIFAKHLRNKRQAEDGLIETDEEGVEEFLENFQDFKDSVSSKIANLTCVLTKLGKLDSNLQINMDFFNNQMWEQLNLKETLAGQDPVWRQHMTSGFNDCHQIAQSFPQEALDQDPLSKVFGRHMLFFKCAKKVQMKGCKMAQIYQWLEMWYGKDDGSIDWTQWGLPKDKYERAAISMVVKYDAVSEEERFVADFFQSRPRHQEF